MSNPHSLAGNPLSFLRLESFREDIDVPLSSTDFEGDEMYGFPASKVSIYNRPEIGKIVVVVEPKDPRSIIENPDTSTDNRFPKIRVPRHASGAEFVVTDTFSEYGGASITRTAAVWREDYASREKRGFLNIHNITSKNPTFSVTCARES